MARTNILTKLLQDRSGATAIEYGFILGLVVIAMFLSLNSLATTTVGLWNTIATKTVEAINGT